MFKLVHPRAWDPVVVHDWFNLIVIGWINTINVTFMATGTGFDLFFTSAMVYFLLDTIFVGVYPQSVKSPVVILSHHICTALYMLIPYSYPRYQWCMAYCMLVEINTWLLIARRTLGGKVLETLFYVSWVLLRNIFYPYLIWAFYNEWQYETKISGTPWNWIIVTPICQAFLSGLNYHWTLQLVFKILRAPSEAKYGKHLRKPRSALAEVADAHSNSRSALAARSAAAAAAAAGASTSKRSTRSRRSSSAGSSSCSGGGSSGQL